MIYQLFPYDKRLFTLFTLFVFFFVTVLGRCVPAIITELVDSATDLVQTDENTTIVDKLNNTISKLDFDKGSE